MKKKLWIVLLTMIVVVSLCISFSACGGSDSQSGTTQTQTPSNDNQGGTTQTPNNEKKEDTQPAPPVSIMTDPVTVTVRTETVTITDSGRKSQKMDVLFLSDYVDVKEAYNAGYTKLRVTVTLDVKEIDDGYQYIFLYSDTNCKSNSLFDKIVDEFYDPKDPSLLYEYKFEHDPGAKNTKWGSHSFTATLKMERLKDDLYIRYGASGKNDDDWQNKNVVVTFQVVK